MRGVSIAALVMIFTSALAACGAVPTNATWMQVWNLAWSCPPDLSEVEAESRFELPEVFAGDDSSARNKVPVLAKVDSLRLEGSADLYWLAVDEPVTNLYQQVKNFWSAEGFRLVMDEPVIGIMQTEWIYSEQGGNSESASWIEKIFGVEGLSESQDQFRTRIERDDNGKSRIYIAHRGTEEIPGIGGSVKNNAYEPGDRKWRFRQPEPELEVEMLSRLMIYLGLQKAEVEQQLSNIKMFAPRASMHIDSEESSPYLLIKDAYQIAWNRVYHEIERLNFDIDEADFKSGLFKKGTIKVNIAVATDNGESGLFSIFSSDKSKDKQFVLVLSAETDEMTRVIIETAGGKFDTSPEGAEFLTLLYQQIK